MVEALAAMKGNGPWARAKEKKLAKKLGRGFQAARTTSFQGTGEAKVKIDIANIKARTRCANCGERGHWHKERTKPRKTREQREKDQKEGAKVWRKASRPGPRDATRWWGHGSVPASPVGGPS